MRQTGILAASAAYALTYNYPQLPRVHALAKRLEEGLEELGVRIMSGAETCMVTVHSSSCATRLITDVQCLPGIFRPDPSGHQLPGARHESERVT